MRKLLWIFLAALAVFPAAALCRQSEGQSAQPAASEQSKKQATDSQKTPPKSQAAPQESPLVEAARRARKEREKGPKAAKVYTNDNLPTQGGISSVGSAGGEGAAAAAPGANDEKTWRAKFAQLRQKLQQDQSDLAVLQRELGVANVQYYSDPTKTMMQELTREDINKKTAQIDKKKKDIEADKQAIADAEDALRKSGGDPGWAH